ALFEKFNIEVLATTDRATDPLTAHRAMRESGWPGRVIPTFRPDALFRVAAPAWNAERQALGAASGLDVESAAAFVRALAARRQFFASMGATATDHAVVEP